jgi:hypothetical protein
LEKDGKFSSPSAIGPIKKPVFSKVVAKMISYLKNKENLKNTEI